MPSLFFLFVGVFGGTSRVCTYQVWSALRGSTPVPHPTTPDKSAAASATTETHRARKRPGKRPAQADGAPTATRRLRNYARL